jgi:hypothetical protein
MPRFSPLTIAGLLLGLSCPAFAQDFLPSFPPQFGETPFGGPFGGLPMRGGELGRRFPENPLAEEVPDADEAEKAAKLREKLASVVAEKAALLNSAALEAEIAREQRHIRELKALQGLHRLRREMEAFDEKYRDSDAGRQVQRMLQQLRRNPGPSPFPPFPGGIAPFSPFPQPRNDDDFREERDGSRENSVFPEP